jgi:formylglycine-generating enzyme required for sulfatase activity
MQLGWGGFWFMFLSLLGKVWGDSLRHQSTSQTSQSVRPVVPETPRPKPSPSETPKPEPQETKAATGVKLEDFQFETVQLSDMGKEIKREKRTGKLFNQPIGGDVSLKMVQIPKGKFLMGSPDAEAGRSQWEGPQHEVSVPEFFMAQTPITQAQWKAVAKRPKVNIDLNPDPSKFKGDRRPVESISWEEAQEFCDRFWGNGALAGLTYRLPSEAEWEYACRAGTTTPFHFGETIATDVANYRGTDLHYSRITYAGNYGNGPKGEFREQTTDIQTFPANPWGLYDMHGNVWECCADHWHQNYQGAPIDGSAWLTDKKDANRLVRGGSWIYYPVDCRSSFRLDSGLLGFRSSAVGFRVCVSVSA